MFLRLPVGHQAGPGVGAGGGLVGVPCPFRAKKKAFGGQSEVKTRRFLEVFRGFLRGFLKFWMFFRCFQKFLEVFEEVF